MATTSKGRVFLSYGHDAACEGLVERIKADLEAQGWEPWVDRHRIEFGDDWRREITKGIRESQHVLAFLSRHSTRKPGVCRQEVAIALGPLRGHVYTVLVEPLSEVTPPLIVSRLQWLDMQRWREMQESDPAGFDALYRDCVAQILRVLERNQPFAGEIDELHRWLQPLDATGDMIDAEAGFHGRDWLLGGIGGASPMVDDAVDATTAGEIEKWRTGGSSGRVLWLAAQPGWGKSAVAARLAHAGRSRVLAVHFCKHDRPGTRDARQVVRTLAFQMSTQLGDYRQLLLSEARRGLGLNEMNAKELFHALLVNPLAHALHGDGASDDLRLLVIDALDETLDANGRSELLGLIASDFQRLPPWLGLVVTSRPEAPIIRQLGKFGVKMLAADDPRNREDLRESADGWLQTLSSQGFDRRRALNAIMQACSGNFLYLRKLREAVAEGVVSVENLQEAGSIPGGLSSLYERWFQHRFHDVTDYQTRIRPLLEMMLAAWQPLPIELAGHVLSWGAYGGKVTQMLGTLCAIEDGALSFFHKSLRDWLADPEASGWDFHADEEQGHRLLADYMWSAFLAARPFVEVFGASRGWGRLGASAADYALRHLPAHLRRLDRGEDMREALLDFGFAMNRCAIGGVEPFLEDYREVRGSRCEQLTAWADCIIGRSDILRRGEQGWPANRIFLQIALEHADDSTLTIAAEGWLRSQSGGWSRLRCRDRPARFLRDDALLGVFGPVLFGSIQARRGFQVSAISLLEVAGAVAVGGSDGSLQVFDAKRQEPIGTGIDRQGNHNGMVQALVSCNRTGRFAASRTRGGPVVWSCRVPEDIHELPDPGCRITDLAFSADGSRLAASSQDGKVRIWDLDVRDQAETIIDLGGGRLRAIAWSEGDSDLLGLGEGGELISFSLDADRLPRVSPVLAAVQGARVRSAACSADGHTIVAWSDEGGLRVIEMGDFGLVETRELDHDGGSVFNLAVTPDGRFAVSGGQDKTVRVWDLRNGTLRAAFTGHVHIIKCVAIDGFGNRVYAGSSDGTVRVWDAGLQGSSPTARVSGEVTAIAEIATGDIVIGYKTGVVHVLDPATLEPRGHPATQPGQVWAIACSPEGDRVTTVCQQGSIRLIDPREADGAGDAVQISFGGAYGAGHCPIKKDLYIWGKRGVARIASISDVIGNGGRPSATLPVISEEAVRTVVLHPQGRVLFIGGMNGVLFAHDTETAIDLWRVASAAPGGVFSMSLSPDRSRIAIGGGDGTIKLYDTSDGRCLLHVGSHSAAVNHLRFDRTGRRLVSASWDETVRIWDVRERRCIIVHHVKGLSKTLALADDLHIVVGTMFGEVRVLVIDDTPKGSASCIGGVQ